MQDRFKFRIWNGTEMHYNDFVVTATGFVGKITEEFLGRCVFNQEDLTADKECILMQCTGMKDKTGTLIYEGDIVTDVLTNKFIINFNKNYLSYLLTNIKTKESMVFYPNIQLEVIGNIYENKDLLNEKET